MGGFRLLYALVVVGGAVALVGFIIGLPLYLLGVALFG